jgi:hypothetical protein
LKQSQTRILIAADTLPAECLDDLEKLLKRLRKYGDRVFLQLSETARDKLTIDLTAFQMVLVPVTAG